MRATVITSILMLLFACGRSGGSYAEKKAREWMERYVDRKLIDTIKCSARGPDPQSILTMKGKKNQVASIPPPPSGWLYCILYSEGDAVQLIECPTSRDSAQYGERRCRGPSFDDPDPAQAAEAVKKIYEGARSYYQEESASPPPPLAPTATKRPKCPPPEAWQDMKFNANDPNYPDRPGSTFTAKANGDLDCDPEEPAPTRYEELGAEGVGAPPTKADTTGRYSHGDLE